MLPARLTCGEGEHAQWTIRPTFFARTVTAASFLSVWKRQGVSPPWRKAISDHVAHSSDMQVDIVTDRIRRFQIVFGLVRARFFCLLFLFLLLATTCLQMIVYHFLQVIPLNSVLRFFLFRRFYFVFVDIWC